MSAPAFGASIAADDFHVSLVESLRFAVPLYLDQLRDVHPARLVGDARWCAVTAIQLELFPAAAPSTEPEWPTPDWGVLVHETRIFATRLGADWWMAFTSRFESTPRMTCLGLNPMGGEWHVACDSKEEAQSLAEHMVSFGGVPKSAVEVKQLAKCKRWSA